MDKTKDLQNAHRMTAETMDEFIDQAREQGASDNMVRRYTCTVKALFDFLPEDKTVTRDRLLAWRKSMEDSGYASITILNYVKYINKYLDYVGCSEIRFNRGRAKDITGMTFGYLTALEPTEKRDRHDVVWRCQCKCGKIVELPATRMLMGNTLSCGCLNREHLQRANKYVDNTSLRQALEEKVESKIAASGYTGVIAKRNKWQAMITYKGKQYSLGCYEKIGDAVRARARAKQLVQEDAQGLLDFYEELHKEDPELPNKDTVDKKEFPAVAWKKNREIGSRARKTNNTSGHTGVHRRRGRWEATISHRGIRYYLGTFVEQGDAIQARARAEQDLKADPEGFGAEYQEKYRYATYGIQEESER